jgi:hypothetical protein
MSYKGRYTPTKPKKYKGNPQNIIYRSLWERKFMVYCDNSTSIIEWGSEEIIIPYLSPKDGRMHRYIKVKQADGQIKKMVIEVKPKVQCKPPKEPKRRTKRWMNEVITYGVNDAKWRYATEWCADNDMEFKILTEDHLGISYK